jgi:diguanylate cyclase (GGDEF)-like protein
MALRISGRHDSLLLGGFAFALLMIFQRTIQQGLEVARDIERIYGVALVPALLVLTVMFVFHQTAKRREGKAEAASAAHEAMLARARTQELEQLMLFGQALAQALNTETLREAVWRHLPALSEGADAWVLLRSAAGWERLTDTGCSRWPAGEIEYVADYLATQPMERAEQGVGLTHGGHTCFVMIVSARAIGVVGVPTHETRGSALRKVGAAAALLTIAARNAQLFADVRENSVKDDLTGCVNRGHGVEMLEGELVRARRAGTPLSIVLFDVDHFKRINDRFGHLCGDRALAAVGQRLRQVLRRSDIRCRYGGDEFMVVLPETPGTGAVRVAEWLRGEIEHIDIEVAGDRIPVTVSVGVAESRGGDMTADGLIERADQALYRSKADGRNCVRTFGLASAAPSLPLEQPAAAAITH